MRKFVECKRNLESCDGIDVWLGFVIHAINIEIWWGNLLVNAPRRRDRRVDGTVDQVWTTFYVAWKTSSKFHLHAGNVKFITQKEEEYVNVKSVYFFCS
jgi:hypothetical protein